MYNITHNNPAVSAEELGMVAADGRTKANHNFKFRATGAVKAQLHGSFVARTIPEWNRLSAAAADAVSPALFHSRLNAIAGAVYIYPLRDTPLTVIRQPAKGVMQSIAQDKTIPQYLNNNLT